jgi:hypothetical protein
MALYYVTITECTDRGEQEPFHGEEVSASDPNEAARICNAHSEGLSGTKRLYRRAERVEGENRWIAWCNGKDRIDVELVA